MELISLCIAVIGGFFVGRIWPWCRARPAETPERAIAAGPDGGSPQRKRITAEEKKAALRQARETGALPKRLFDDLLARVDRGELQSQLSGAIGADSVECPWLQETVEELWPLIDDFIAKDILTDLLEPLLQDAIGKSVKFTRKTLGNEVPRLGPMRSRVTRDSRGSGIELSVGLKYVSNCDIKLQIGVIEVGVANLSIVGTALVYLRPLVSGPIFLGGMEIAFLNPPEVELDFRGIGSIVEIPGLRDIVLSQIVAGIGMAMVLPARIAIPIDDRPGSVYGPLMMCPEPAGFLRVTFYRADDVLAADVAVFGQATSDPYVKATLSMDERRTPFVPRTVHPVWVTGNVFDFPVHSPEQILDIEVYDSDTVGSDDLLGHIRGRSVAKLMEGGSREQTVPLEGGQGTLTFSVQWLDALGQGQSVAEDGKRLAAMGPGKYDETTGRKKAERKQGEQEPVELPDGAVLLSAWWGSQGQWENVSDAVNEVLCQGSSLLADPEKLGCQARPGAPPSSLVVEYIVPEGPNVGVMSICLESVVGLKEDPERGYKWKIEVRADSWEEPKTFETAEGAAPPDQGPVTTQQLEETIVRLWEEGGKSTAEIGREVSLDEAVIKALVDKDHGMRVKYAEINKSIRNDSVTLSDAQLEERHAEAARTRLQWQNRALDSWRAHKASGTPVFNFAAHVPVPPDWHSVTLRMYDRAGAQLSGVRFPSRRHGGSLTLGRVIAGTSSRDSTGVIEFLDHEDSVTGVRQERMRNVVDGPFKLSIDKELLEQHAATADGGVGFYGELHARVQLHALIPREPVSYNCAIVVEVIRAKNLVAMDLATGASDPYIKVRYGDKQFATNVVARSLTPIWKQRFEFACTSALEHLDFECYDSDLSGLERFMGRCNVNPFGFIKKAAEKDMNEREARGWYVDPSAPPPRVGHGWRKLTPRLGNEKDWQLVKTKGRTIAMGLGMLEISITVRGDFPEDWSKLGDDLSAPRQDTAQPGLGGGAASAAGYAVAADDSEPEAEEGEAAWTKDEDAKQCKRCQVKFGTLTRKHHCRRCGGVFCDNCSSHRVTLGPLKDQRVCEKCAQSVLHKKKNPLHALLGDELAAMYLDEFIRAGQDPAALKRMTPGELRAYFDKVGVQGALHRQAIHGRIALFDAGGLPRRSITVHLLRGSNLIVQDAFTSDPFVVVTYRGVERKTPVIKRSLNPVWGHDNRWTFPLTSAKDAVELLCLDWDREGEPDFMGYARILPMSPEFRTGAAVDVPLGVRPGKREDEIVLKSKGHKKGLHPLGVLQVRVRVDHGGNLSLIEGAEELMGSDYRGANEPPAPATPLNAPALSPEWCAGLYDEVTEGGGAGAPTRGTLLDRLRTSGGVRDAEQAPEGRDAFANFYRDLSAHPDRPMGRDEFVSALLAAAARPASRPGTPPRPAKAADLRDAEGTPPPRPPGGSVRAEPAQDTLREREMSRSVPPADSNVAWVPDDIRRRCKACKRDFGTFRRKHHCRKCGDVFCDACTAGREMIEGWDGPQRVCTLCPPAPTLT
eukprot:TRINITY_DN70230_c0_g1_i1.p1 TRINITY_DN70230_c0_g1~~TRINITY_DN70230_c0_g1_i1.p1  ORF type:complete len:1565 (+),score=416.95 TRINITY_DN70230_c0_g1_i1:121-4695(+)